MESIQSILALRDGFECYDAPISNPIFDSIIAFPVQVVYCWRIWVLSGWRLLPGVIGFSALAAASAGFVHGITNQIAGAVTRIPPNLWFPIVLWFVASAIADILIAVSMTYLLLRFKSEKYMSRNLLFILRRLLIFTLEANILTALVAITTLVFALVEPIGPYKTNFYITTGYNIGKVYSNCFMILLNQRRTWPSQESLPLNKNQGTFSREVPELSQPRPVMIQSDLADTDYGQVSTLRFSSNQGQPEPEDQ
ncbi:hypothetical protein NP233_g6892 [Leucocoprinus birnbaumii]|uniref:DUF6534 domain-containing protein n=1 Tax=Leucocoprinus birnbaumii TaxID=56174 RepID=A0AAD5VQB5_9AGAR|nr:hypothetical protein NP233_g6892 [Leucocoprinus birnbaumii]